MYPEDRVIVGVINRKRDFVHARDDHWYRIPQKQMPNGINTNYLAFFLSGTVFKEQSGGVHYFAKVTGTELVRRRELLPKEAKHKRANEIYYRVSLEPLKVKIPPILNPTKRSIAFIYTTWDRFIHASTISDLYTKSEYYVDRLHHALGDRGIKSELVFNTDKHLLAGLTIEGESGSFYASLTPEDNDVLIDPNEPEDELLAQLYRRLKEIDGARYYKYTFTR